MSNTSRLTIAAVLVALLSGCASQNPYDNQGQQSSGGMSKTAKYGGLGALAGAVAGAAINHDNRGKGALIGAAVAGAAGAGYGYYVDKQEEELRRSMQGTGVEVQRQGDTIQLIMPGNITFATDSADIASSFYTPLNNLAGSFRQYNQNSIEIVGHTDSKGTEAYNYRLGQRRADSVAHYLTSRGVPSSVISTNSRGELDPVAPNTLPNGKDNPAGRALNRRVVITVVASEHVISQ